jgi:hypothetical protein
MELNEKLDVSYDAYGAGWINSLAEEDARQWFDLAH